MPSRSKKNNNFNYEKTIAEVEEMIEQIESGSLALEDVFEKFAQAVEALGQCETYLNRGKQRMDLLIEILDPTQNDLDF
jgi:exodeoxyribonuclease VII small subunit